MSWLFIELHTLLDKVVHISCYFLQLIEQEAMEIKNKFGTPRRSLLEDAIAGQLEDIDVIPNEEMLLVYHLFFSPLFVSIFML